MQVIGPNTVFKASMFPRNGLWPQCDISSYWELTISESTSLCFLTQKVNVLPLKLLVIANLAQAGALQAREQARVWLRVWFGEQQSSARAAPLFTN